MKDRGGAALDCDGLSQRGVSTIYFPYPAARFVLHIKLPAGKQLPCGLSFE